MSLVDKQVWKCDECGHEWLPDKAGVPKRCPSRKCRSARWHRVGEEVGRVVSPVTVVGEVKKSVGAGLVAVLVSDREPGKEEKHAARCGCNKCVSARKYGQQGKGGQ